MGSKLLRATAVIRASPLFFRMKASEYMNSFALVLMIYEVLGDGEHTYGAYGAKSDNKNIFYWG
jgi:hypothetical protein